MADIITLDRVSIAFRPARQALRYALRDLSLRIAAGSLVGIVGNNGSGKSTLAQLLAGTLPKSQGQVTISGRVAMVFQNPDTQIIGETVFEDICFGLENRALPASEMQAEARAVLQQVGLDVPLHQPIGHLSGGQRQLHCIAAALALKPDILIFDEATAMLNPPMRRRILDVAHRLTAQGTTVLWITQWLEEAAEMQRLIALESGRIVYDGTPATFFYGGNDSAHDDVCVDNADGLASPCQALGWPLPFAIQTALALQAKGIKFRVPPLTLSDLVSQVTIG